MKKYNLFFIILIFLTLFLSCQIENKDFDAKFFTIQGIISIDKNITLNSRMAIPSTPDNTIFYISAEQLDESGNSLSPAVIKNTTCNSDGSFTIKLPIGKWKFTAYGSANTSDPENNKNFIPDGQTIIDITSQNGQNTNIFIGVKINTELITETQGNISLTFTDETDTLKSIRVYYKPDGRTLQPFPNIFPINNTLNFSLASGAEHKTAVLTVNNIDTQDYLLYFDFFDNSNNLVYSCQESVSVIAGLTTNEWIRNGINTENSTFSPHLKLKDENSIIQYSDFIISQECLDFFETHIFNVSNFSELLQATNVIKNNNYQNKEFTINLTSDIKILSSESIPDMHLIEVYEDTVLYINGNNHTLDINALIESEFYTPVSAIRICDVSSEVHIKDIEIKNCRGFSTIIPDMIGCKLYLSGFVKIIDNYTENKFTPRNIVLQDTIVIDFDGPLDPNSRIGIYILEQNREQVFTNNLLNAGISTLEQAKRIFSSDNNYDFDLNADGELTYKAPPAGTITISTGDNITFEASMVNSFQVDSANNTFYLLQDCLRPSYRDIKIVPKLGDEYIFSKMTDFSVSLYDKNHVDVGFDPHLDDGFYSDYLLPEIPKYNNEIVGVTKRIPTFEEPGPGLYELVVSGTYKGITYSASYFVRISKIEVYFDKLFIKPTFQENSTTVLTVTAKEISDSQYDITNSIYGIDSYYVTAGKSILNKLYVDTERFNSQVIESSPNKIILPDSKECIYKLRINAKWKHNDNIIQIEKYISVSQGIPYFVFNQEETNNTDSIYSGLEPTQPKHNLKAVAYEINNRTQDIYTDYSIFIIGDNDYSSNDYIAVGDSNLDNFNLTDIDKQYNIEIATYPNSYSVESYSLVDKEITPCRIYSLFGGLINLDDNANLTVENLIFTSFYRAIAMGSSNLTIKNCQFEANQGTFGGDYADGSCILLEAKEKKINFTVINSSFWYNHSDSGAISLDASYASGKGHINAKITDTYFGANQAETEACSIYCVTGGTGFIDLQIDNSTFLLREQEEFEPLDEKSEILGDSNTNITLNRCTINSSNPNRYFMKLQSSTLHLNEFLDYEENNSAKILKTIDKPIYLDMPLSQEKKIYIELDTDDSFTPTEGLCIIDGPLQFVEQSAQLFELVNFTAGWGINKHGCLYQITTP